MQNSKSKKARTRSMERHPVTPPELSTGFEIDLHHLIHEDERMHPFLVIAGFLFTYEQTQR